MLEKEFWYRGRQMRRASCDFPLVDDSRRVAIGEMKGGSQPYVL